MVKNEVEKRGRGRPAKSALTDDNSYDRYRIAIYKATGNHPTRKNLERLGRELGEIAGRRPWSEAYLYSLLYPERYPQYKLRADLLRALEHYTGLRIVTTVMLRIGGGVVVEPGSIVTVSSRACLWCETPFIPAAHNARYCSRQCSGKAKRSRDRSRHSS